MRVTFLGVRGSTPAPGPQFARYGGHTSCVAVARTPQEPPTLVLDAGTGIRNLPGLMGGAAFRGAMLLSHLHWDHVQGIPFCPAADHPDARVEVYLPAQEGRSGRDLVAQLLSPPAFPITPEGLQGSWAFHAVEPGARTVAAFDVVAFDVAHKGGRTFGYRVGRGPASIGYVPDHAPAAGVGDAALAALAGVGFLVHDAQFLEAERPRAQQYAHATVRDAVALAQRVGAGTLVLFHHGPHRTDGDMDAILADIEAGVEQRVLVAREGMVLDIL